jgi:hypothetical protein
MKADLRRLLDPPRKQRNCLLSAGSFAEKEAVAERQARLSPP